MLTSLFVAIMMSAMVVSGTGRWVKASADRALMSRECLHVEHVKLYDELLRPMRDLAMRRTLDADALTQLAHDLRTGRPFCDALMRVKARMHQTLQLELNKESRLYRAEPLDMQTNGWQPTLDHLAQLGNDFHSLCALRHHSIERNDTRYDTGPLSFVGQCINKYRKAAVADHIVDRHADEERAASL